MTNKYQKHTERLQKEACEKNQKFFRRQKKTKGENISRKDIKIFLRNNSRSCLII